MIKLNGVNGKMCRREVFQIMNISYFRVICKIYYQELLHCPSASESISKDIGSYINKKIASIWWYHNKKHNKTMCIFYEIYCTRFIDNT